MGQPDVVRLYPVGDNSVSGACKETIFPHIDTGPFMTCVCTTYICIAPEGFRHVTSGMAYGMEWQRVVIALAWFIVWKKTNRLKTL